MTNWWQWLTCEDPSSAKNRLSQSDILCASSDLSCANSAEPNVQRLVSLFVWVGVCARVIRYYLCFPLWDDESFLCVNFIGRSLAQLLQPLDYHQVAPILFLWVERAMVQLFGFSEYALRLLPFVCSIASLFVFRRVAERLLSGRALFFAVAIFAISYPGIRYAAEAKPYGTDTFISLVMLLLVVEWKQRRDERILGLLQAMMPIALGFSYPAVFAAGGLSLVVGGVLLWQRGTVREWALWAIWNFTLVVSFVILFRVVGQVQGGAEGEFMGEYWKQSFPPMSQPWLLPYWMLKTHASDFLAYPLGGPKWASTGTLLLCIAGLWQFVRTRQAFIIGLLLGPAGLHFLAAALQKYPYGGHVKFSQYLAPMICCLAGIGAAKLLNWRPQPSASLNRRFAWGCVICLAIGGGAIARDLVNPFKTRSDFRARAFAQSFWMGAHSAEEVICMETDIGHDFVPEQHRELSWSAHYLCNRAIEVSRSSLRPANLTRVSPKRPLRCVMYHDDRYPVDQERLNRWLDEMRQSYDLVAHESVPFPRLAKNERTLVTMEYIDSYKFVPREASANEILPLAEGRKSPPQ